MNDRRMLWLKQPELRRSLGMLPENSMGCKIVDVILKCGKVVPEIVAMNSEVLIIPLYVEDFEEKHIDRFRRSEPD